MPWLTSPGLAGAAQGCLGERCAPSCRLSAAGGGGTAFRDEWLLISPQPYGLCSRVAGAVQSSAVVLSDAGRPFLACLQFWWTRSAAAAACRKTWRCSAWALWGAEKSISFSTGS